MSEAPSGLGRPPASQQNGTSSHNSRGALPLRPRRGGSGLARLPARSAHPPVHAGPCCCPSERGRSGLSAGLASPAAPGCLYSLSGRGLGQAGSGLRMPRTASPARLVLQASPWVTVDSLLSTTAGRGPLPTSLPGVRDLGRHTSTRCKSRDPARRHQAPGPRAAPAAGRPAMRSKLSRRWGR
jgi:hypothetical protein